MSHSVIPACNSVSDGFREAERALIQKYALPKEEETISEKIKRMEEWWEKGHSLYIGQDLTRQIIRETVQRLDVELREGTIEVIKHTGTKEIPFLVFSAGISGILFNNCFFDINK